MDASLTLIDEAVDIFNLDVFKLQAPVIPQVFAAFNQRLKLQIDPKIIIQISIQIEDKYHSNPYHNAFHAADVAVAAMRYMKHSQRVKRLSLSFPRCHSTDTLQMKPF